MLGEFASHLADMRPVVEPDAEHARWLCDREAEILVRKRLPGVRVGGRSGSGEAGLACGQQRADVRVPLDWSSVTVTHDGGADAASRQREPSQPHRFATDRCMELRKAWDCGDARPRSAK